MYIQAQLSATILSQYGLADLPTEARYFVVAAVVMLALSILAMLSLYLRRWWMNKLEKKKADIKFRYQYFIYDALVGKRNHEDMPSVELIINRFRKEEMDSPLKKQIMTDLLIELKRSFNGASARQFINLYKGLGLQDHGIAKLQKRSGISRVGGIRELSELAPDCPQLVQAIDKWQHSANRYVADEARLAAVRTQASSMFAFLDTIDQPAEAWLQIKLHRLLQNIPEEERPLLAQWLKLENPFALRLMLRLITELRQQESAQEVTSLLNAADDEVKKEALHCLSTLEVHEASSKIFNLLDTENEQLKVAAVQTIGQLGTGYHAHLLRPLLQADSPVVREATLQAISSISHRVDQEQQISAPYSETSNY